MAQTGTKHLPLSTHRTENLFIYFSQFPSLRRSQAATRNSYKGTMALATICSSTFPHPPPSPPDAVQRWQDPTALGDPCEPDVRSEPVLATDLSVQQNSPAEGLNITRLKFKA